MKIKYFTSLPPAEVLYLTKGTDWKVPQLIFLTMMDLLFRKVLQVQKQEEQNHPNGQVRSIYVICTGENYKQWTPKSYEQPFYSLWQKDPDVAYYVKTMVGGVYKQHGDKGEWVERLNHELIRYRATGFFSSRIFSDGFNRRGKVIKKRLGNELDYIENKMRLYLSHNEQKALVAKMGANAFITNLAIPASSLINRETYGASDYMRDMAKDKAGEVAMEMVWDIGSSMADSVGNAASGFMNGFLSNMDFN
ncbi:hypothetical protein AB9P05_12805 [Roseivirga sp. BDSF3-8]|uniref:hypothetical protein n=1 Tax=Roseivirga sp. BDSF3-8 TaxID=3241598 RepID=UPI0035325E4A